MTKIYKWQNYSSPANWIYDRNFGNCEHSAEKDIDGTTTTVGADVTTGGGLNLPRSPISWISAVILESQFASVEKS